jgi:UDPglucose 6-dehydrogenase
VNSTIEVNEEQRTRSVQKILAAIGGNAKGKTVGILGLSFKPNTDDMRDSPSVPIVYALLEHGIRVKVYDPVAMDEAKKVLNGSSIQYCSNSYEVAEGADALVFVTEWNQFRKLDMEKMKDLLKNPIIVDLRNIYDPQTMRSMGFTYIGVGR